MYFKQEYSDRILGKVEELASRVHLLKDRLAKQKEARTLLGTCPCPSQLRRV